MKKKIIDLISLKTLTDEGKNSIEIGKLLGFNKKFIRLKQKELGINYNTRISSDIVEKECLYCKNTFLIKRKKDKNFCNRSCSTTFNNIKRYYSSIEEYKENKKARERYIFTGETTNFSVSEKLKIIAHEKLLKEDFSTLSFERLRQRVILEQDNKCGRSECGLNEWFGKKISLELDHVDGNNKNNERVNLIALCPNCHSITSTWRGRNKIRLNDKPITDDEYLEAYNKFKNVRQALLSLNIAAKGGNYKKMYKVLELAGIHFKTQSGRKLT